MTSSYLRKESKYKHVKWKAKFRWCLRASNNKQTMDEELHREV